MLAFVVPVFTQTAEYNIYGNNNNNTIIVVAVQIQNFCLGGKNNSKPYMAYFSMCVCVFVILLNSPKPEASLQIHQTDKYELLVSLTWMSSN